MTATTFDTDEEETDQLKTVFISLAIIALISAVVPVIAHLIPRNILPETVLLIAAGALLGPNMAGVIRADNEEIVFLADLGCAFLFLLAGYEIDPKSVVGRDGKHGLLTWIVTFAVGLGLSLLMPSLAEGKQGLIATALLMTTTALGTLMPILKDRALMGTREGDLVLAYGTWGELATVLAVAILLSVRTGWQTALILFAFFLICIWFGAAGMRNVRKGTAIFRFLESRADSTSQTMVRVTILMLVVLVTFSSIFDLDIVLGAFAAGFILRFIVPEGNKTLEMKLDAIAYGFLIPLFFVVSGCKIDLRAVSERPGLLLFFIAALVLVRCIPIVVSLAVRKDTRSEMTWHNRLSVAFYGTTALPLIVAITGITVGRGIMEEDVASVLVAAGAITVFLMPFLASASYHVSDAEPIDAIREITHDPGHIREIIHEHIERKHEKAEAYRNEAVMRIRNKPDSEKD